MGYILKPSSGDKHPTCLKYLLLNPVDGIIIDSNQPTVAGGVMRIFTKYGPASALFVFSMGAPSMAYAQQTCGAAQMQLQQYVVQVNQIANYEYYQGIGLRCSGNAFCANTLLQQLNAWYLQQSYAVNNWYMMLVRQCSSESSRRPPPISSGDISDGISEEAVETLEVDDEDRTVAIRIPDNPAGFRPGRNYPSRR